MIQFGIDRLIRERELRVPLHGKRIALLAHPASVTETLSHSIDVLTRLDDIKISCAFSPQHGMRGEKQDNMVESETYVDERYQIPVFSLYGEVRRPTEKMMSEFDVILIDLQDLGCRIYTFITTLLYILQESAKYGKSVWVLDRPNPAGRPLEGSILEPGWESFVGAGPVLMRHGLTMGELALWFKSHFKLDVDLQIIEMTGYKPSEGPGYGWPLGTRSWVNPSPNASNLSMARCYAGTVLLEGTHFSEGRGTTHPLEVMGAPGISSEKILKLMQELAPEWLDGCRLRPCYFEPTFHKHAGKLCEAIQIHVDDPEYAHERFKPYRIVSLFFKAVRILYPEFEIWRDFPYEYEKDRLAIDLIHGGPGLREWVDDPTSRPEDFETLLSGDEKQWRAAIKPFLRYF